MEDVNNIRVLCAEMVEQANSGHPGAPISLAPLVYSIFSNHLKFDPTDTDYINRDIFILSNGHACAIHYVHLYLTGRLVLDDLKKFRQLGSRTPGHPEKSIPGIECTSGPLGQGLASSVGYAIALQKMKFMGLTNRVYCVFGDGCYQEGVGQEAFSLAANLKLDNITFIYDYNKITIDGPTTLSLNEDVVKRFESLGYLVCEVEGEDIEGINKALMLRHSKPVVIILHTIIGLGCIYEGKAKAHGSPIGPEGLQKLKEFYKQSNEPFHVRESLLQHFNEVKRKNFEERKMWNKSLVEKIKNGKISNFWITKLKLKNQISGEANKLNNADNSEKNSQENVNNKSADNTSYTLSSSTSYVDTSIYNTEYKKKAEPTATRKHFSEALNDLLCNEDIICGSADLFSSCLNELKSSSNFTSENTSGQNISFGIREHAMFGTANGISAYGYHKPMFSTFVNFVTYGYPSVRIGCMDKLDTTYVLTHDSIGLGEDGPTHQPIEVFATMRATPNLIMLRPCDGKETRAALAVAMKRRQPTAIILSRQKLPELENTDESRALRGAYTVMSHASPDIIILATGSEVSLAIDTAKKLSLKANVVSFMSWELFDEQNEEYRKSVLEGAPCVSIEAASTFGWQRYASVNFGMHSFGESAPGKDLYQKFGFTAENLAKRIEELFKNKN